MANSTASSTSVAQKPGTSSSTSSNHKQLERKKSCDTICSSNTSCFLQKRKPVHPLAASVRFGNKGNPNAVKQRVLSAKLIKLRSVQSQLNDANFHLSELAKENHALRTLQRRQDKALKSYEGVDAELPKLIKTYEEELRVVQDKNKTLKRNLKDSLEQLKAKDEELNTVKTQLKHLTSLTKDKHLGEREKLKRELSEASEKIKDYENQIAMLNRRLMLESKNAKYKLNNEIAKHKQCQRELANALEELHRNGHSVPDMNYDMKPVTRKKILTQRPSITAILKAESTPDLMEPDGKLEQIDNKELYEEVESNILQSPAERVRARLSAGNDISNSLKNLSIDEHVYPKSLHKTISNHKLNLLSETIENTLKKASVREPEETELGNFCLDVVKSVKTMNTMVDKRQYEYQACAQDTTKILDKLKEVDMADAKIRKMKSDEDEKIAEKDLELVDKIWFEEYNFRKSTDTNGNVKDVSCEDKKKLLATLKAIDNGESIDNDDGFNQKSKKDIIKQLFG